jgi:hypothetical protein
MSQENVDTFGRAVVAYNSRDVEALVADAPAVQGPRP